MSVGTITAKLGRLNDELKFFGWIAGVFVLAYFLPLSNPKVAAAIQEERSAKAALEKARAGRSKTGGETERRGVGAADHRFGRSPMEEAVAVDDALRRTRRARAEHDPERMIEGDIDGFIKSYLKAKAAGTLGQAAPADD